MGEGQRRLREPGGRTEPGLGGGAASRWGARRGRFSGLLRGEGLEVLSRELGVTAATLSGWREAFLGGGEASLRSRAVDERDERIARLQAKVGEVTMANELLEEKIGCLEAGRPLAGRRSRR